MKLDTKRALPWNQPREGIGDDVKPALGPSNSGANGQTWEKPAAFYVMSEIRHTSPLDCHYLDLEIGQD
jgi:hypothetical protein